MKNPFRRPATAPPAPPRACPGCGCPLDAPGWRSCPRCRRELDGCSGCSACGRCSR